MRAGLGSTPRKKSGVGGESVRTANETMRQGVRGIKRRTFDEEAVHVFGPRGRGRRLETLLADPLAQIEGDLQERENMRPGNKVNEETNETNKTKPRGEREGKGGERKRRGWGREGAGVCPRAGDVRQLAWTAGGVG